jgi:phospholipid transport system substrate-binding protein
MLLERLKNNKGVKDEEGLTMKRQLAALGILMLLVFALPVYAGVPLDTVQKSVNKVLDVLRDPKLKADSAKEMKKEKLRIIYKSMFDEIEFSKRTLAKNWSKLNAAQQKEFVDLFEQILEKSYIDKILSYTNEKIEFYKENMNSETQAEIQTKIVTSSKEIPIFYRVIKKDNVWKVYDVVVENVSLVQNYRTQFNDILTKNTPEQLLEILRKKVKDQ